MAQPGYTPILLYASSTPAALPLAANLAAGELAINTADGKLFFKNSSGVVSVLANVAGAAGPSFSIVESTSVLTNQAALTFNRTGAQTNGTGDVGYTSYLFNGPGSIGTYEAAKLEVTARNTLGLAGQGRAVLAAGGATGSYLNGIDVGGPTYQTLDLLGQDGINFYCGVGSSYMNSDGDWVFNQNVTGRGNVSVGPLLVNQTGSALGMTKTSRLMGRYAPAPSPLTSSYFFDYENNGDISVTDANAMLHIPIVTDVTGYISEANALPGFGTSYGTKNAGMGFISGTATDITKAVVGLPPLNTGAINAVSVGYMVNGPRILLQDRALDGSATVNPITYVAGQHIFVTSSGTVETDGGLTITQTGVQIAGPLMVYGTIDSNVYTVATLPTGNVGMRAAVSDAVAPTFLGALTGGGTVKTPVFHNGTAWVAG